MTMLQRFLLLTTVVAFFGCTTPVGISNYQSVGSASLPNWRFVPNTDYRPPAHFKISPSEVVATHGSVCREHAHYNCTYFVNDGAYFLLPDYGVVPSLAVSRHAVVIVDGRTGKLLKAPNTK